MARKCGPDFRNARPPPSPEPRADLCRCISRPENTHTLLDCRLCLRILTRSVNWSTRRNNMTCVTCGSDKRIAAKGECYSCYMRARRAKSTSNRRRKNGETLTALMSYPDQSWRYKILGRIDPTPTETGCHEWQGPKTKGGYGIVSIGSASILAHRAVHAFNSGDSSAAVVMHTCDNPSCCNPAHLRSGTYEENMQDMIAKGRGAVANRGTHLRNRESHPRCRRIKTPLGEFASAALAAEHVGLHYKTVLRLAEKQSKGFSWI